MRISNKFFLKILLPVTVLTGLLSFINAEQPEKIKDFRLLNVDGKYVSLSDYPDAKGFIIVFTCNHCPFAKLYPERLNNLNSKYAASEIPVIAISSTDTLVFEEDNYESMVSKAKNEHFNFPYLYDNMQEAAKNFNAQKTPHAYVLWKENDELIIKYSGAIDDNGAAPENVKNRFVENAVDDLLSGNPVRTVKTSSIGCQIKFRN